jgi:hypothetical protein
MAVLVGARAGPSLATLLGIGGFMMVGCVVPSALILTLVRIGRASAVDLRERSERVLPSLVTAAGCATAAWLLNTLDAPPGLSNLALAIAIQMAVLALITTRWKVSYHTASASALMLVGRSATSSGILTLLLFVLATGIAWARIYQRRHTIAQVAVGALTAAPIALLT